MYDIASETHALIPAHNESDEIVDTITALISQVPPDRVTVVADNCTDDTVELATRLGVAVIETVDNTDKKAGALNQALGQILPRLRPHDRLLILDADTRLAPTFISSAERHLTADPGLGAIGGLFYGHQPLGWLQRCQYNEYLRYSRDTDIKRRVAVLTGTASVIRVQALRQVAATRGTPTLPGEPGDVYDRSALTEDMELTLALLTLGWSLASPADCSVLTQLMPTIRALREQRVRWYRGALENLQAYGWTPVTRRYIGQQVMLLIGALAMMTYLVLTGLDVAFGFWALNAFWSTIALIFIVERVLTAWPGGWRSRLMCALLVPELVYDVILQCAFFEAVWNVARRTEQQWHHNTS